MDIPRLLTLFPHLCGVQIDAVSVAADGVTLEVHATRRPAPCPLCDRRSKRVQSTYLRTIRKGPLGSRPCGGLPLTLRVRVRLLALP